MEWYEIANTGVNFVQIIILGGFSYFLRIMLSDMYECEKKITWLASFRDEDMNRLTRLEQKVARIHGCNGCNQKKKKEVK